MKVMVPMCLAAENPAITEEMRAKARNGSAEETEAGTRNSRPDQRDAVCPLPGGRI